MPHTIWRRERTEAQRYHDYAQELSRNGRWEEATVMYAAASNLSTYQRLSRVSAESAKRYATFCLGELRASRWMHEANWGDVTTLMAVVVEGMWQQYAGLAPAASAGAGAPASPEHA